MGKIIYLPPNREEFEKWKRLDKKLDKELDKRSVESIINEIREGMIKRIVHLTELELDWDERAPDWYKGASFELYLEYESFWTLDEFRLIQEAVFDYRKQCDQYGIGTVVKILTKSEKPEEVFKKIEKRQSKRKTPLPAHKKDEIIKEALIIEKALKKGG